MGNPPFLRARPLAESTEVHPKLEIFLLIPWSESTMTGREGGLREKHRFIYNSDANNMFLYAKPPMKPKDIEPYIDEISNTGVTTLYVSPNLGMKMNYPSRIAEMLTLDHAQSHNREAINLHSLLKAGCDPLGLVIDLARERGLEVFISFRLNEVHAVDQIDSPILSRFWKEHPEWRIGTPGDPVPDLHLGILGPNVSPVVAKWLPGALNFEVAQVRERRLAELREVCERYPIDGLDLDFQRFPVYFPFGSEAANIPTMTSWMRAVRRMTRDVSEKRSRPILLSARVMARPKQNLGLGLDPSTWAEEGLVDFVIISHYLRNDFALPVAQYREILPAGMPLYASIEVEPDPESYRRIARKLWTDGVDGIMLFNFFTSRERGEEPPFELLNELGDPSKLAPGTGS